MAKAKKTSARGDMFGLPRMHLTNLLVLRFDDALSQAPHFRIFAVPKFNFRHVDRSLMMREHPGNEVTIGIAAHRSHH
jgi:hypothetical protein